jgi:hypothetical protein
MSIENTSKLNQLLSIHPKGGVILSKWLNEKGYSYSLQAKYRINNWFETIGRGALIRKGEEVNYLGGIYALQRQAQMSIHPAALTALSLTGNAHYARFYSREKTLMGGPKEQLPQWFQNHQWEVSLFYIRTSLIKGNIGLTQVVIDGLPIHISSNPRALLECLYLAPKTVSYMECQLLMENLNNLQPAVVQELLENCTSIKVKRLFLYMATKADHQWVKRMDITHVDLGKGKRSLAKDGVFISEYNITVPKELAAYG